MQKVTTRTMSFAVTSEYLCKALYHILRECTYRWQRGSGRPQQAGR